MNKSLKSFLLKLNIISIVLVIQVLIFYYFKDGMVDSHPNISIRTYLDGINSAEFYLANHISGLMANLFFLYLGTTLVMVASQAKNNQIMLSIIDLKLSPSSVAINFIAFILILIFLIKIQDPQEIIANHYSIKSIIYRLSPILWIIYLYSVLSLIFPFTILLKWIVGHKIILYVVLILIIITVYPQAITGLMVFWSDLLLQPTIYMSLEISRWFGFGVHIFPGGSNAPIFGTNRFQVEILPTCSGFEGMSLAICLLGIYCYLQRNILRNLRSLLIIPLACTGMFFLNAVRIVILIMIGHFYSPELALKGFHTVGGWLNLLLVLVFSILLLNQFSFFIKAGKAQKISYIKYHDEIYLFPLSILIILSLLTKIFTTEFDWLYPIPTAIAASLLFYFRDRFRNVLSGCPSILAVIIGVLVFFIWIRIIPVDEAQNRLFIDEIESVPMVVAIAWLLFRIIGAVLIVPFIEELAFRGYFLCRVEVFLNKFLMHNNLFSLPLKINNFIGTIFSIALTSFLFGLLHSSVLAGSIAGFGYSLSYVYRRKLVDAIFAHCITNALLVIDVLYFGNWNYW